MSMQDSHRQCMRHYQPVQGYVGCVCMRAVCKRACMYVSVHVLHYTTDVTLTGEVIHKMLIAAPNQAGEKFL